MQNVKHEADFQQKLQTYKRKVKSAIRRMLQQSIVQGVQFAMKRLPPQIGKKNISQRWYKRQMFYLPAEVRESNTKNPYRRQDIQKLHQGFLYRLLFKNGNSRKKNPHYYTTQRNAKKQWRIKNRGLLRYAMGATVQERFGIAIPEIQKLLSKSPNLAKHKNLNRVKETSNNQQLGYHVSNIAIETEGYRGDAEKISQWKANKNLEKRLKQYFAREHEEL